MRVLHVIPSLDKRDGGPSVALPLMARGLAPHGVSVDVATTISEEDASEQGIPMGDPLERDGYTVRFFKRQTHFYKASLPLLRWLNRHIRDYALVHNHALFSFAPLAGARAARRSGVPYIMRPLGLLNTWGMENRRRWIKALSFRLLDRPALNHAAVVHYTSTDEEKEAARLHLRSRPVVVPLGIDLEPFRALPDKEVFFSRFPTARGRQIILFLSRLDPKKGIEVLLEALRLLGDAAAPPLLVIAGGGDPDYVSTLAAKVADLRLENHVLWAGFLEGTDRLAAFSAADAYVLPSYSENFGIALVEAMAAGLACVTTHGVAVSHSMQTADAGIVVSPDDPAALTEALRTLLHDPNVRSQLGANASRLAEREFSLVSMGSSLRTLYGNILSK